MWVKKRCVWLGARARRDGWHWNVWSYVPFENASDAYVRAWSLLNTGNDVKITYGWRYDYVDQSHT
jgi:hypothetical protein